MPSVHTDAPFLKAIRQEPLKVPPVWLMRQAGRYLPEYRAVRANAGSFLDLCYNPELAAEVTLQPIRRYDFDAAILFCDILVIPDALGQSVAFKAGEGPVLDALEGPADIDRLCLDRVTDHLAPVFETVRTLREALPANKALIGFAGAPWTVATYMVEGGSSKDFATIRQWAYRPEESGFDRLMDHLVAATVAYLDAQIRAGADVVKLFDSWAGVLPDVLFDEWVIEPTRRIVEGLKARHPDVPVIGFARGAGFRYARYRQETGIDVLALDQTVPLGNMAGLAKQGCVQGNLDPAALIAGGDMLKTEVTGILDACKNLPLIFNLGHGITPETPPEHVADLMDLIRSHG